jgi:hypothetical protein
MSEENELPELPKRENRPALNAIPYEVLTADQMRAYARAALASARPSVVPETMPPIRTGGSLNIPDVMRRSAARPSVPQEPVAWLWKHPHVSSQLHFHGENANCGNWKVTPLYAAPQEPQEPQPASVEPAEPHPCEEAARCDLLDELEDMRLELKERGQETTASLIGKAIDWIDGERVDPTEALANDLPRLMGAT